MSDPAIASPTSFASAATAFERAAQQAPDRVSTLALTLAGRPVQLHIAGRLLAERLRPAFSHLTSEAASDQPQPELTLRIWDAADTGVASPDIWHDDPGLAGVSAVSGDSRVVAHRGRTSTHWHDRQTNQVVACFADAARLALADRSRPLQRPLAMWHFDRRVPFVHAGVVARDGRGVLFPGKGGSGKTTASLSCALAGFDYLGDDCVGLERAADTIRVHSVYASASVERHHLERFPALKPYAIPGATVDEDKDLVLLPSRLPKALARTTMLAAIALPRIVDSPDTRLRPASRAEALRALAPSTLLFFPGAQAPLLAFLASVVAAVPCYWLEMGRDIAQIPGCLDSILHV